MSDSGMVSVILPTYQGASRGDGVYLEQAVRSVLSQTYEHLELIIVNDGSSDNTDEVCRSFADPRVRYVSQENRGLSAARNTGLATASGEYVSFLDDDDFYYPDKTELQIQHILDNDSPICYCYRDLVDSYGASIGLFDKYFVGNVLEDLLNKRFSPAPSSVVMTRRDSPFPQWD